MSESTTFMSNFTKLKLHQTYRKLTPYVLFYVLSIIGWNYFPFALERKGWIHWLMLRSERPDSMQQPQHPKPVGVLKFDYFMDIWLQNPKAPLRNVHRLCATDRTVRQWDLAHDSRDNCEREQRCRFLRSVCFFVTGSAILPQDVVALSTWSD